MLARAVVNLGPVMGAALKIGLAAVGTLELDLLRLLFLLFFLLLLLRLELFFAVDLPLLAATLFAPAGAALGAAALAVAARAGERQNSAQLQAMSALQRRFRRCWVIS